ncbi:hypothetical protein Rxycam_02923 [Rubrobacter xylanophilus DSM 9941]|nr:hypothetical protein Rxycam_02923 [Rubrobacter xylanophilus DSM 9941]
MKGAYEERPRPGSLTGVPRGEDPRIPHGCGMRTLSGQGIFGNANAAPEGAEAKDYDSSPSSRARAMASARLRAPSLR